MMLYFHWFDYVTDSHIYVEDQWKSVGDVLSNDTMINEKITKVCTRISCHPLIILDQTS